MAITIRDTGNAVALRCSEASSRSRAHAKIGQYICRIYRGPPPAQSGTYKITLSSEGWIDVLQGGNRLKSIAATGATGCEGIRKSVKFDLAKAPFTVHFSGIENGSVAVAISHE